jgi:arylsulfatase A
MRLSRRTLLTAAAPAIWSQQRRRPNVILILTDDQGWWDTGASGNPHIDTPNMDRLAAEGVNYTRFYASPVCAPTRASLMTGRYYLRTGIYNTRFGGDTLAISERTLAEILRESGYRTGLFGKWHLGHYRRHQPDQRGFDEFLGFTQGHIERYFHPDQLLQNGRRARARGNVSELFTDSAIQFVRENRSRPFFCYVAFNEPHAPNYVDNPWVDRYLKRGLPLREAQIYGMVSNVDRNIGRLLATLDSAGLRENTVLVFASDNGGVSRFHQCGLRGNKASAFEGGIRVPCFVRWPGRLAPATKDHTMRGAFDLFNTICEIAAAPLPSDRQIDGLSLLGSRTHERLFHIWDRHRPSVRSNWSVTEPRFKLVGRSLFDLSLDSSEKIDLAASEPAIARRLRGEFDRWLDSVTRDRDFTPPPIEVGRADENPVELLPSWARVNGTHQTWGSPGASSVAPQPVEERLEGAGDSNYTFAGYDWDSIDGWKLEGDAAIWRIDVVRAGRFRVRLVYGCDRDKAGGRWRLSAGGQTVEGDVEATGGRNVFHEFEAGGLDLPVGPATLRISPAKSREHELMALNGIWLERI